MNKNRLLLLLMVSVVIYPCVGMAEKKLFKADGVKLLPAHQSNGGSGNGGADLRLSGHTHGGMLFFLKALLAHFNGRWVLGRYKVNGTQMYVSPGTGLWAGFFCRLGVPSEITRIVLRAGNIRETI